MSADWVPLLILRSYIFYEVDDKDSYTTTKTLKGTILQIVFQDIFSQRAHLTNHERKVLLRG